MELLIDPLHQERAERGVRGDVGHDQPHAHQDHQRDRQPDAKRHGVTSKVVARKERWLVRSTDSRRRVP